MSNNLLEELKYKIAQYEEQVKALTQNVNQKNLELNKKRNSHNSIFTI